MNIEYSFTVTTKINLKYKDGNKNSQHSNTECSLTPSKNLDDTKYHNKNGMPNKEGCKAITETLIQGIIANIHFAHQKNYRDSAEHLRDIIKKLEEGFIDIVEIENDETNTDIK